MGVESDTNLLGKQQVLSSQVPVTHPMTWQGPSWVHAPEKLLHMDPKRTPAEANKILLGDTLVAKLVSKAQQ